MRESKADDRLLRNLNGLLALIHFKLHLQTYILIRAPMSHHDSESEKKKISNIEESKKFLFQLIYYICFCDSLRVAFPVEKKPLKR